MIPILLGLLAFQSAILIHELGHLVAARRHKVRVLSLSLGFGPAILAFRLRPYGILYRIGLIPFGGYCKMAGDELPPVPKGRRRPPRPRWRPGDFFFRPPLDRIAILLAGPLFNILAGLLILVILSSITDIHRGPDTTIDLYPTVAVAEKTPDGLVTRRVPSPALRAGLRSSDRIVAVDGTPVRNWKELESALAAAKHPVLTVRRGRTTFTTALQPLTDARTGQTVTGLWPLMSLSVDGVAPSSPAEKAGLRAGDLILRINGRAIPHWTEFNRVTDNLRPGRPAVLTVRREDKTLDLTVIPAERDGRAFFGLVFAPAVSQVWTNSPLSLPEAVAAGLDDLRFVFARTFAGFRDLFSGRVSEDHLPSGPVGIVEAGRRAAGHGPYIFLRFFALLNLLLAAANLVPLPPLDGSHIVVFGVEAVLGRPLDRNLLRLIEVLGVGLLSGLILLALLGDLRGLFRR